MKAVDSGSARTVTVNTGVTHTKRSRPLALLGLAAPLGLMLGLALLIGTAAQIVLAIGATLAYVLLAVGRPRFAEWLAGFALIPAALVAGPPSFGVILLAAGIGFMYVGVRLGFREPSPTVTRSGRTIQASIERKDAP